MLASVGVVFFARHLPIQRLGPALQIVTWTIVAGIAGLSVSMSCYVVIRYPYISLVSTSDEDTFSKQFVSKRLMFVAKLILPIGLFRFCVLTTTAFFNGDGFQIVRAAVMAYFYIQFVFTLFLCFWYDPVTHPTVATFIRATLGIGLILVPLLLPVLFIGSIRCKHLLDAAAQATSDQRPANTSLSKLRNSTSDILGKSPLSFRNCTIVELALDSNFCVPRLDSQGLEGC